MQQGRTRRRTQTLKRIIALAARNLRALQPALWGLAISRAGGGIYRAFAVDMQVGEVFAAKVETYSAWGEKRDAWAPVAFYAARIWGRRGKE
jgi:hypothetical protein